MSALNVFNLPKVGLRVTFDPDDHFISIGPKTKTNKHVFADILNHLQTVLQTFDLKNTAGTSTFKVGDNVDLSVIQGVLRSKGFSGGESVEDAASVAEKNLPTNNESLTYSLDLLFESTYRSAPYWNDIFQYSGKSNKSMIQAEDILRMRKIFTKKPKSKVRDKVLRALDKASRYFTKKLRKTAGESAAESFKEQYKNIGSLIPDDYSEDMGPQEPEKEPTEMASSNPANDLNLSDFFNSDKDSYDDIEIERT